MKKLLLIIMLFNYFSTNFTAEVADLIDASVTPEEKFTIQTRTGRTIEVDSAFINSFDFFKMMSTRSNPENPKTISLLNFKKKPKILNPEINFYLITAFKKFIASGNNPEVLNSFSQKELGSFLIKADFLLFNEKGLGVLYKILADRILANGIDPSAQALFENTDPIRKLETVNYLIKHTLMDKIFEKLGWENTRIFKGHTSWVNSVAFSPNKKLIVSGSEDNTVRLWDIEKNSCINIFEGHFNTVLSVAFSPDGTKIASGSLNRKIMIWSIKKGNCSTVLNGHTSEVNSVVFSPDGTKIASGGADKTVRLWDTLTYKCINMLNGHTDMVLSVAFSPDGTIISSVGRDKTVRIWDTLTGDCLNIFYGNYDYVDSMTLSPNGTLIALRLKDRRIMLYDVEKGKYIYILNANKSEEFLVAFNPDDTEIALGSINGEIKIWHGVKLDYNIRIPEFIKQIRREITPQPQDLLQLAISFSKRIKSALNFL